MLLCYISDRLMGSRDNKLLPPVLLPPTQLYSGQKPRQRQYKNSKNVRVTNFFRRWVSSFWTRLFSMWFMSKVFLPQFVLYPNQHFAKHLYPVQNIPFLLIVSFFYQTVMTGLLNIFAASIYYFSPFKYETWEFNNTEI